MRIISLSSLKKQVKTTLCLLLCAPFITACGSLEYALPSLSKTKNLSTVAQNQPETDVTTPNTSDESLTTASISPTPNASRKTQRPLFASLTTPSQESGLKTHDHINSALNRALGSSTSQSQSVTWINPESGAFGVITPVGDKMASEGQICQAVIISEAAQTTQKYFQATACHHTTDAEKAKGQPRWRIKSLKPMENVS